MKYPSSDNEMQAARTRIREKQRRRRRTIHETGGGKYTLYDS